MLFLFWKLNSHLFLFVSWTQKSRLWFQRGWAHYVGAARSVINVVTELFSFLYFDRLTHQFPVRKWPDSMKVPENLKFPCLFEVNADVHGVLGPERHLISVRLFVFLLLQLAVVVFKQSGSQTPYFVSLADWLLQVDTDISLLCWRKVSVQVDDVVKWAEWLEVVQVYFFLLWDKILFVTRGAWAFDCA